MPKAYTWEEYSKEQWPEALKVVELSTDEYLGYLVVHEHTDRENHRFVIMGDLRPMFDAPEEMTDDAVPWGNYAAEAKLVRLLPPDLFKKIVMDPEGATFFAYAGTLDDAKEFLNFVAKLHAQGLRDC